MPWAYSHRSPCPRFLPHGAGPGEVSRTPEGAVSSVESNACQAVLKTDLTIETEDIALPGGIDPQPGAMLFGASHSSWHQSLVILNVHTQRSCLVAEAAVAFFTPIRPWRFCTRKKDRAKTIDQDSLREIESAMIDCHAHVFPSLEHQALRVSSRVPSSAGSYLERGAIKAEGALETLKGLMGPIRSPLGIEASTKIRERTPAVASRLFEGAASVFGLPVSLLVGSARHLLDSMDRYGIEKSIVIGAPLFAPNEWLLSEARVVGGERFVPVGTLPEVSPSAKEEMWLDAWSALADAGSRGFKIHLNTDGLPPGHVAYRSLFEVAKERRLFVIVHTGLFHVALYKEKRSVGPHLFEPLLRDYPDVRVCFAHMNREYPELVWSIMKRFSHAFTDTSWQPAYNIQRAIEAVGDDRILLGSDWPLLHGDLQGEVLDILQKATGSASADRIATTNGHEFIG